MVFDYFRLKKLRQLLKRLFERRLLLQKSMSDHLHSSH